MWASSPAGTSAAMRSRRVRSASVEWDISRGSPKGLREERERNTTNRGNTDTWPSHRILMVGLGWRRLEMLQAQRSSGRGISWRLPAVAAARALPGTLAGALRDRTVATALAAGALSWIVVAQAVEARHLVVGVMLHLGLLAAGGATAMVAMSRARRANDAATQGVVHDLRGPLVSLQATLELLASDGFGTLPAAARDVALRAAATSGHAADIVDHTFRRASTVAADLDAVLHSTLAALDVQVRSAGATVELASLPRVAADPAALFRVFVNLLQNALKYHQPGRAPRITVTASVDGAWATIAVADDGIGIAPAERTRVFEIHYRTASGIARAGGEGLGLATVARLIGEAGGTVWVDPEPGRGTTIRVRLPLA
ncbi:MAG: HAMP domain-containing histidine kinase [Dehalococcoidia bacterium]|nr:MAG: HAMP domain-containing histidine kinase [Dehalococcoidia bacterium]